MRVVDRRRGVRRDRGGDRAARHGFDDVVILDRARRARRHLAPQRLPGRRLRRPEPPVLVLVRAAPPLDAAVLAARRDPRLPARGRARARHRPARHAEHRGRARATTTTAGRSTSHRRAHVRRRRADRRHRPAAPARTARASEGTFAGHSFHSAEWDHDYDLRGKRVAVIGTGRERRAVRARDRQARSSKLVVFQRTGNWFLPRTQPPVPALVKARSGTCPGVQAFRRRFIFWYGESLTLMIRHPRTLGADRSRALAAVHALAAARTPSCAARSGRTTRSAASACCSARTSCPRCSGPNVELVTEPDHAAHADAASRPAASTRSTASSTRPASATTDFMFPMEIAGRDGARCARRGRTARTRTWGSPSPASRRCS